MILFAFHQFTHFNDRIWFKLFVKIDMRLEDRSLTVCVDMLCIVPHKGLIGSNKQCSQYDESANKYEVEEAFEVLAVDVDEIGEAD